MAVLSMTGPTPSKEPLMSRLTTTNGPVGRPLPLTPEVVQISIRPVAPPYELEAEPVVSLVLISTMLEVPPLHRSLTTLLKMLPIADEPEM